MGWRFILKVAHNIWTYTHLLSLKRMLNGNFTRTSEKQKGTSNKSTVKKKVTEIFKRKKWADSWNTKPVTYFLCNSHKIDRSGDFFNLFLCIYLFFVGGGGGGGFTSLSLVENSGHLTWVRHSSRKRAVLPIPISVCSVFICPNNGMAASVWNF